MIFITHLEKANLILGFYFLFHSKTKFIYINIKSKNTQKDFFLFVF